MGVMGRWWKVEGGRRTCKEVFMNTCELDVGFRRTSDDQAVYYAVRYGFGHRMPQQALHHHGPCVGRKQNGVPCAREVRQRRFLQRHSGHRREAQCVVGPTINRALELGCRVLCMGMERGTANHAPAIGEEHVLVGR